MIKGILTTIVELDFLAKSYPKSWLYNRKSNDNIDFLAQGSIGISAKKSMLSLDLRL